MPKCSRDVRPASRTNTRHMLTRCVRRTGRWNKIGTIPERCLSKSRRGILESSFRAPGGANIDQFGPTVDTTHQRCPTLGLRLARLGQAWPIPGHSMCINCSPKLVEFWRRRPEFPLNNALALFVRSFWIMFPTSFPPPIWRRVIRRVFFEHLFSTSAACRGNMGAACTSAGRK